MTTYLKTGGHKSKSKLLEAIGEVGFMFAGGIAVASLGLAWALVARETKAKAVRTEVAEVVAVDSSNLFTTFELGDGHRVRREGLWGKIGDRVPLRVNGITRELAE